MCPGNENPLLEINKMNTQEETQTCQVLSARALSKLLQTSVRSIWRYRSSGHLPKPVKISGAIRWKLSDIELFLQCNCDMQRFNAEKGADYIG